MHELDGDTTPTPAQSRPGAEDGATEQLAGGSLSLLSLTASRIHGVKQALRRAVDMALHDIELTGAQYGVLYELRGGVQRSAAEIAQRRGVRPQTLTAILDHLQSRGLLERSPHPTNGRMLSVSLTPRGHEVLTECDQRVHRIEQQMLSGLNQQELSQFANLLGRCLQNLEPGDTHLP